MDEVLGGGASRSTDPASGSSAATDVSLREHITALIVAAESRFNLRLKATEDAVRLASAASDKRLEGFPRLFADTAELKTLADKLQSGIDRNREDIAELRGMYVTTPAHDSLVGQVQAMQKWQFKIAGALVLVTVLLPSIIAFAVYLLTRTAVPVNGLG